MFSSAVGTGLSVYGGIQQAKAIRAQTDYNQRVAEEQARTVREDSSENRRRMREDKRRHMSRARARFASLGLDEQSGTPLEMYGETASVLEQQIADEFVASERRATALENQASLTAYEGRSRETGAKIGAYSSLGAGLGSLGSKGFTFLDRIKTA